MKEEIEPRRRGEPPAWNFIEYTPSPPKVSGRSAAPDRRGRGFESRTSINIFQASFSQLLSSNLKLSCVNNCDNLLWMHVSLTYVPVHQGRPGGSGIPIYPNKRTQNTTSFPGLFRFELSRRPNSKEKTHFYLSVDVKYSKFPSYTQNCKLKRDAVYFMSKLSCKQHK